MSAQIKTEKKLVENYLSQHNLEQVINEVVNFCVRDRPKDPFHYLGKAIAEKSTSAKGIIDLRAFEVLDNFGKPTLEVEIVTDKGTYRSQVANMLIERPKEGEKQVNTDVIVGDENPEDKAEVGEIAPASELSVELSAVDVTYKELRDLDATRYKGQGVQNAIEKLRSIVTPRLLGLDPILQEEIDELVSSLDGTDTFENLGVNTCLATSITTCRAGASAKSIPLYRHIASLSKSTQFVIPVPCFALISGGNVTAISNVMAYEQICLLPTGADNFAEALQIGRSVYEALEQIVQDRSPGKVPQKHTDGSMVIPMLTELEKILDLVLNAIEVTGFQEKCKLSITVNANNFFNPITLKYDLHIQTTASQTDADNEPTDHYKNSEEMLQFYRTILEKYPDIISLEDPFHNSDIVSYRLLTEEFGEALQIAGDQYLKCKTSKLENAILEQSCNAMVMRMNCISNVTEMVQMCRLTQKEGFGVVLSTNTSETADTYLADIAVGLQIGIIKCGPPHGSANLSKYNTLLRIESDLGEEAFYAADRFRQPV